MEIAHDSKLNENMKHIEMEKRAGQVGQHAPRLPHPLEDLRARSNVEFMVFRSVVIDVRYILFQLIKKKHYKDSETPDLSALAGKYGPPRGHAEVEDEALHPRDWTKFNAEKKGRGFAEKTRQEK